MDASLEMISRARSLLQCLPKSTSQAILCSRQSKTKHLPSASLVVQKIKSLVANEVKSYSTKRSTEQG